MPDVILFVLTPNFTDSFDFIDSEVVKIITPCGFFSPDHPSCVLKDSKLNSLSYPNSNCVYLFI